MNLPVRYGVIWLGSHYCIDWTVTKDRKESYCLYIEKNKWAAERKQCWRLCQCVQVFYGTERLKWAPFDIFPYVELKNL